MRCGLVLVLLLGLLGLGGGATAMSLRLPHPTPGTHAGSRLQRLHPTRSQFSA